MSVKEDLMLDLKSAMKVKNVVKKNTIQMVRAAVLQAEKDKQIELDDNGILEIISKQVKQKEDSLGQFEKAGRDDLVMQTKREINILKEYLPEAVERSEIAEKVIELKVANNYSKKDMGKLIKELKEFYGVRANGKDIADCVKQLL